MDKKESKMMLPEDKELAAEEVARKIAETEVGDRPLDPSKEKEYWDAYYNVYWKNYYAERQRLDHPEMED
ncbi:MAG: hypothetical protein KGZ30_04095 [Anaplasmataceae bacterium]|nr:hypothetical protein [Anaplasmataceae bacterium]